MPEYNIRAKKCRNYGASWLVFGLSDNQMTIIVGVLKNIDIDIEDCVIGSVRVGNQIDVSEKFIDSISDLTEESTTFAWVNIKSDSLYNAFSSGKNY